MKIPPKTYLLAIVVVIVFVLFLGLSYANIIEEQDLFWVMQEFIFRWSFTIVFAIIGGVLVGMILAYRILSVNQFTPFEKSMLEMRSEIKSMKETFDRYNDSGFMEKMTSVETELKKLQEFLSSRHPQGQKKEAKNPVPSPSTTSTATKEQEHEPKEIQN